MDNRNGRKSLEKASLIEALKFWTKLGFISFGGPAGQIAIMHREVVERRRWVGEHQFLRALNFCMLLPGPEAQQLATYIGWRMNGTWGGIAAGIFGAPLFGGMGGVTFGAQLAGSLLAVIYALVTGTIIYGLIRLFIGFRLSEEDEFIGPDLAIHNIHAYPEETVK